MRYFLLLITVLQLQDGLAQKNQPDALGGTFVLKGKLQGRDTGYIVLWYPNQDSKWVRDTSYLKNGRFKFNGMINEPSFAHLIGSNKPGNYSDLYIEPIKQQIKIVENKFSQFKMRGSKTQLESFFLFNQINKVEKEIKVLQVNHDQVKKQVGIDSSSRIKQLEEINLLIQNLNLKITQLKIDFIKKHPDSYVSATELNGLIVKRFISLNLADSLLDGFTLRIKQGLAYRYGFEEVEKSSIIRSGKILPDFKIADINDNEGSLSQFRGKYLLIDFWASWCIPCRRAVPGLKELYNKYGGDAFEILAISKDKIKQEWEEAVKKDGINIWFNIIMNKELNDLFQSVIVLPTQLLIDPEGKIIWNSMEDNDESWEEMLMKSLD